MKSLRIRSIKFLLDLIDHKWFNTRFVQIYKKIFSETPSEKIVIFDVGGHNGEFISLFSKIFPGCQIHSFEPDEQNFQKMERKFKGMDRIHLNPFGIGNMNTKQKFYRNVLSYTSSYKEIDVNSSWAKTKSKMLGVKPDELIVSESEVPMRTLDSYAQEHGIEKIHILKMDVEGYELKCLEGCRNLLENHSLDSIQLEVHLDDMYKEHYSQQDVEKILSPFGYSLYKKSERLGFRNIFGLIYIQNKGQLRQLRVEIQ